MHVRKIDHGGKAVRDACHVTAKSPVCIQQGTFVASPPSLCTFPDFSPTMFYQKSFKNGPKKTTVFQYFQAFLQLFIRSGVKQIFIGGLKPKTQYMLKLGVSRYNNRVSVHHE